MVSSEFKIQAQPKYPIVHGGNVVSPDAHGVSGDGELGVDRGDGEDTVPVVAGQARAQLLLPCKTVHLYLLALQVLLQYCIVSSITLFYALILQLYSYNQFHNADLCYVL